MPDRAVIGAVVRERYEALELAQTTLAKLTGLSRGTLRNIETGLVTPNQRTWAALERVLGWAPGSLDRLEKDESPVEILPVDPLGFILSVLMDMDDFPGLGGEPSIDDFTAIMAAADASGVLPDERFTELLDLVFALRADEDDISATIEDIERYLTKNTVGVRARMRLARELVSGEAVQHETFGYGTVVKTIDNGSKVIVEFSDPVGVKKLVTRYAPLEKVDSSMKKQDVPSSNTEGLSQPPDPSVPQEGSSIFDCWTVENWEGDAIAVKTAAFIFKKDGKALTTRDRQYLAQVMATLGEVGSREQSPDQSYEDSYHDDADPDEPPF